MKDDNFINLIYLLSIENIYNEALNSFDVNSINNSKTTNNKINNVGNNNDNINNYEINNTKNSEEGKVTKKINKRRD